MEHEPLTVGAFLDAIKDIPGNTHVATEDGAILSMPMPGGGGNPDAPVELTLVPMPPDAGQSQTVADIQLLLDPYTQPGATTDGPGPDSPLVLAPFGAAASAIVGVAHTMTGLVLQTQPL